MKGLGAETKWSNESEGCTSPFKGNYIVKGKECGIKVNNDN